MDYYKIPKDKFDEFFKQYLETETQEVIERPKLITPLSQNDSRWKNEKLGNSNLTIGNYGCFITAYAMLSDKTPSEINDLFKKNNLFSGASVKKDYNKIKELLNLDFDGESYDGYLKPTYHTIKEVDFSPAPGKQQHFVIRIYDPYDPNGGYIVDTWDGQKKDLYIYPFTSYRLFKQKS